MAPLTTIIHDLKSNEAAVREAAAKSLYHLGEEGRPAYPVLLQSLLNESCPCPWVGAAIVQIGPQVDDLPSLRRGLRHSNCHVRFWIARAIVKLGEEGAPLTSDLIKCLLDTHSPVIDSAMWALGSIGTVALEHLVQTAKFASLPLRKMAILALGRYTDDLPKRVPTILTSLENSDPEIRNVAANAICYLAQSLWHDHKRDNNPSVELTQLVASLQAIATDDSISIDREWLQRIRDWYALST